MDNANTTPRQDDYFVLNLETGKLELHFCKSTYLALDDALKQRVRSDFLWGRNSGCWISRCAEPNLAYARATAESLGLYDAGTTGERRSFAEKMADKAARAERRADRYDARAEAATRRGEALQQPINHMRGDVAFFTQPNINTSAGRAFTKQRDRMWQAFERGFDEFNKSAYWRDRAEAARNTAAQKGLGDKGFVMRRISERERDLRALKKRVEEYESHIAALDRGETPRDHTYGWEVTLTRDQLRRQIDIDLERIEVKLDELGFYQDCLDALGGVTFSRNNLHKGDMLIVKRWGLVRFISGGPKNFTFEFTKANMTYADGSYWHGKAAYAEIERRADDAEK